MSYSNLFIIFLTGLTTGGLSCLAIQGSLLTSLFSNKTKTSNSHDLRSTIYFLSSKLFTHTILGFLLGLLGSSIKLPPVYQGYFQIFLGIYLFGIAGNLLNLHPFFRHFVLTPPKFILRLARKISQKNLNQSLRPTIYDLPVRQADLLSPVLLGGLTIFLPCATTQAMEVLALSSGDPFYSAAIMFAFTLGTIPTFLAFGYILSKGQTSFQKHFPLLLGTFLLAMSLYTINSGIGLSGSVYTFQNFWQVATSSSLRGDNPTMQSHTTNSVLGSNIQTTTINVSNNGYSPSNITLKKNIPTQLKLITTNVSNCSRSFTIPTLNINKLLPETGETTIEFTPKTEGPLAFSCSMGMYTGKFNVVN